MKTYTKETLKKALREIADRGWIPSHRDTSRTRNDGAAGNLLEQLLGIEENNLPLRQGFFFQGYLAKGFPFFLVSFAFPKFI